MKEPIAMKPVGGEMTFTPPRDDQRLFEVMPSTAARTLEVPCTTCGAEAGAPCYTDSSGTTVFHLDRIEDATGEPV
jgi:hypothetical protein